MNVLTELDEDERRTLLASARRRRFSRREVIWHEGDPGETLHLIESGRVAVRVSNPLGDVVTFSILGPGASFGELAVLDATARVPRQWWRSSPRRRGVLHRDQLLDLRRRHPRVEEFVQQTVSSYVARLSTLLIEALYLPSTSG